MDKFFGSKLNSVLLIILIILMIIAIKIMWLNKDTYAPFLTSGQTPERTIVPSGGEQTNTQTTNLEILGNKDDLVSFSILPGAKVRGVVSYRGVIKGGYFFEANISINILDKNRQVIKASNAMATDEWMTAEPVSFEGNIDFSALPKGPAYFEIHNDNPSDMRQFDKSVIIPIVIE